jgi:hypothetical protein
MRSWPRSRCSVRSAERTPRFALRASSEAVGLVALALALAVPAATPTTSATAVQLTWTAPAACPDAASIAADLAKLTRGALVPGASATHRADVVVTAQADHFTLVLEISSATLTEQRALDGPSCDTLARAATLMIAVAVAPVATARATPPVRIEIPPPAERSPSATESVASPPDRPLATPTRRVARDRGFIALWTGPSIGTNPRVTAVAGGDVGWRRGAFGIQLSGWHAFAATRQLAPEINVRASLSGGGARLIYALPVRAIELPISIGIELGALIGSGTGERVTGKTTSSLWAAAALGVGLAWPARGRFALALRTDALVALRAPGIHLNRRLEQQPAFVTQPVGLRVLAGPLLRLP